MYYIYYFFFIYVLFLFYFYFCIIFLGKTVTWFERVGEVGNVRMVDFFRLGETSSSLYEPTFHLRTNSHAHSHS